MNAKYKYHQLEITSLGLTTTQVGERPLAEMITKLSLEMSPQAKQGSATSGVTLQNLILVNSYENGKHVLQTLDWRTICRVWES
jgi:hypothetical protein